MKEQFVTYEIAVKLRELGFNEECLGFYKTTLGDNVPELHIIKCNYNSGKYITIPEDFHTDAPLWQQVIDWLREEHNINLYLPKSVYGGYVYVVDSKYSDTIYNDYYDAREQAILKALELCQKEKQI